MIAPYNLHFYDSAVLLLFMRRTNPFEPLEPIEPAEPLSFCFEEFILWISHLELFHRLQLMETVARLDALDEILI